MALDKLVDSTQLDNNLTSVANAIRAKSGGTGQLAFPAGFVSEIGNISGGGGITPSGTKEITITENGTTTEDVTNYANAEITVDVPSSGGDALLVEFFARTPTTVERNDVLKIGASVFSEYSTLTSAIFPNVTEIGAKAFMGCTHLSVLKLPSLRTINGASAFNLVPASLAFPNLLGEVVGYEFQKLKSTVLDLGAGVSSFAANAFNGSDVLSTLILRRNTVVLLKNVSAFSGTPFASGKAGGTIYIPKALYDHLGDGSSLDYQSATNWSTVYGYGTITWAQIEGSVYETQYGDGTPIT